MKRDMKLVREILSAVESEERLFTHNRGLFPPVVEGIGEDVVAYHVRLLADGGYLMGTSSAGNAVPLIQGLTWKGHDFLDATRPKGIWEKVLAGAVKMGSVTIDMALDAAKELARQQLRSAVGLGS